MVRILAAFVGIVSLGTALLISEASDDRTVKVYREAPNIHLIKKPVLQLRKNLRIEGLGKLAEKTTVSALRRHNLPAEYGLKNLIITQLVTMNVAARARPDPQPEALQDLLGIVSPV